MRTFVTDFVEVAVLGLGVLLLLASIELRSAPNTASSRDRTRTIGRPRR